MIVWGGINTVIKEVAILDYEIFINEWYKIAVMSSSV